MPEGHPTERLGDRPYLLGNIGGFDVAGSRVRRINRNFVECNDSWFLLAGHGFSPSSEGSVSPSPRGVTEQTRSL